MPYTRPFICAFLILAFAACDQKSPPSTSRIVHYADMAEAEISADAAKAPQARSVVTEPRKLIRTVNIQLEVTDTEATADTLQRFVAAIGGHIAGMSARRIGELLHYEITLRVPADRLEETVSRIKALADRVNSESINTEDVTDRYIDLEARIKTLRATEKELQALLSESRTRRHKVEDIMAIYRELTEIRSKIERNQGQLNALERLTVLSTVNVTLTPTEVARPIVTARWRPSDTMRSSARTLVDMLQGLADGVLFTLIVLVPTGIIAVVPVWGAYRLWRRYRPKYKKEKTDED